MMRSRESSPLRPPADGAHVRNQRGRPIAKKLELVEGELSAASMSGTISTACSREMR